MKERPVAAATRLGGMPEITMALSGAKKQATPSPCAKRDQAISRKVTSVLKPANQKDAAAKATKLAANHQRKSMRPM